MIHVCSLNSLQRVIAAHGPSHLVTLINTDMMIDTPDAIAPDRHLRLGMNDILVPMDGYVCPDATHIEELVAFARAWECEKPMVIHCWAGVSRSTAAAYAAVCALNPHVDERQIAWMLRAASPTATPNTRIVALADAVLGRDGRMSAAVAEIGRGAMTLEGDPFVLPARLPE